MVLIRAEGPNLGNRVAMQTCVFLATMVGILAFMTILLRVRCASAQKMTGQSVGHRLRAQLPKIAVVLCRAEGTGACMRAKAFKNAISPRRSA